MLAVSTVTDLRSDLVADAPSLVRGASRRRGTDAIEADDPPTLAMTTLLILCVLVTAGWLAASLIGRARVAGSRDSVQDFSRAMTAISPHAAHRAAARYARSRARSPDVPSRRRPARATTTRHLTRR
jgi:hypothetical protein